MASKLKVDQLRTELAKRGLDATGTKPFLVQRLEGALLKEKKKEEENKENDANNASENDKKKRGRESNHNNNDEDSKKIKAVEEFREMNVKQLREQATLRGLSTAGTKKELIERLSEDAEKNPLVEVVKEEEEEEEEEEKDSSKEEKIVKATKKGAAVLDQGIPDQIKAHYHVLQQASIAA